MKNILIILLIILIFLVVSSVVFLKTPNPVEIINEAGKTGDLSLCDKLKGDNYEQCIYLVAIKTDDVSICDQMLDNSYGDIGMLKLYPGASDVLSSYPLKSLCFTEIAKSTQDVSICERTITDVSRDDCLFSLAIILNDITVCNSIKATEDAGSILPKTVDGCKEYVKSLDPLYCSSLSNEFEGNKCFFRAGTELGDMDICSKIENDDRLLNSCKSRTCEEKGLDCCKKLGREGDRISCVSHYAARSGDKELCSSLDEPYQEQCETLYDINN